jgi:predicted ribosomally synthesized peptide with nif11-like leader
MKTLQDLYTEIVASEELKKAFAQAAKDNKVADFLKAQGCDATEDEFKAFLTEKAKTDKALSDDELENVAGGWSTSFLCPRPESWNGCALTTKEEMCHKIPRP